MYIYVFAVGGRMPGRRHDSFKIYSNDCSRNNELFMLKRGNKCCYFLFFVPTLLLFICMVLSRRNPSLEEDSIVGNKL